MDTKKSVFLLCIVMDLMSAAAVIMVKRLAQMKLVLKYEVLIIA